MADNSQTAKDVAESKGRGGKGREGQGTHEAQAKEEGISSGSGDVAVARWLRATT